MSNRADMVLTRTPMGALLKEGSADTGRVWIFIGWTMTTVGLEMNFVRSVRPADLVPMYTYKASMADTLIRKFPGLARFHKDNLDQHGNPQ